MEKVGAYIHIPFCEKKCYYCDFCAFENLENRIDTYVNDLIKEIKLCRKRMSLEIDSIYIGGGTPSYIDPVYIKQIYKQLSFFKIDDDIEFTIEVNPNTIDKNKLKIYKEIGINRISIGVESFNEKILKAIGRNYNKEIVLNDIDLIKNFGFKNFSIDMMLNLPLENKKTIDEDLKILKKINPNHVSWYTLIIEKGTRFNTLLKKGKLKLSDDDLVVDRFDYVIKELEKIGIKRYEISNFSKKNYESKHNLKYWNLEGYIGFGLNSASYISNRRFQNTASIYKYHKLIEENKLPIETNEFIDKNTSIYEYIILKLRKVEGLSYKSFKEKFDFDIRDKFNDVIEKYKNYKFFVDDEDRLRFSKKGFNLSNMFFVDIIS
ncbi:MAG: radical SAM family heme chaperone HemW [Peptoniphilaceae bacterium]|nr:radical SAM family heme chaperone HemW [Peptoniphilaceae bacterium]MDD7383498.1 radical SAM family heme chaperone HemW [Peptoniphilaceae bacterium]MDY3738671.1 radical SAM family heme chaperone HemW [Peptoniphilaceae bacterium]